MAEDEAELQEEVEADLQDEADPQDEAELQDEAPEDFDPPDAEPAEEAEPPPEDPLEDEDPGFGEAEAEAEEAPEDKEEEDQKEDGEEDGEGADGDEKEPKKRQRRRGRKKGKGANEQDKEEPMLERMHDGKYVVRMRQQLRTPESAERFCTQLLEKVEEVRSAGDTLVFEDFDISQNLIPSEQFDGIFTALSDSGVHVERFRAFGCPTLDDTALVSLSSWLASVTRETAPSEMHLSDCAITSDGFSDLARALENNDAFPGPDPKFPRKTAPLYMRLENNFIEDSAIQEFIDSSVIVPMKKSQPLSQAMASNYKARLLVREDGTFQQKKGSPPAPEDAPPPKPVHDKGKGKGKGKGKEKGAEQGRDRQYERERERYRDRDPRQYRDQQRDYRDNRGQRDYGDRGRAERDYRDRGDNDRDRGRGIGRLRDSGGRQPPWAALPAPRVASYGAPAARPSSQRPAASRPVFGGGAQDRRRLEVEKPAPLRRYEEASGKGASRSVPYNAFSRGSGGGGDRGDRGGPERGGGDSWGAGAVGARRDGNAGRPPLRRAAEGPPREEPAKRPRTGGGPPPTAGARGGGGDRAPAARGRGGGGGVLPGQWQEHWSDEYQLTYFWNAKTGDSSWERPTK